MYYSEACSYCGKIFYTFHDNKYTAAKKLYAGIKKHLISYKEDDKEHKFDDGEKKDSNEIYAEMISSKTPPRSGYKA